MQLTVPPAATLFLAVQFTFRLLPGQVPLKTKVLITQVRSMKGFIWFSC